MTSANPLDLQNFRGKIHGAFRVTGRGTFVTIELNFEGRISVGDHVSVPLQDGSRQQLEVAHIEYADSIAERAAWLALGMAGDLEPLIVAVGDWISAIGVE